MPTYEFLRSYTVVEIHHVEAATQEEAEALLKAGEVDSYVKSFDGDYQGDYESQGEVEDD